MFVATFKERKDENTQLLGKTHPDTLDACIKHFPTCDLHFLVLMARECALINIANCMYW